MFNLRENAFYLLRVHLGATSAQIADALDDAVMDEKGSDSKLQNAKNNLSSPKKRLLEEMLSLWEIPAGGWDSWLATMPEQWEEISAFARVNLAAHFLSALNDGDYSDAVRQAALAQIIGLRGQMIEMLPALRPARKQAKMPPPSEEHFQEALRLVSQKHCQAAMRAIESAQHPGKIMTEIAEEWRYDKTEAGRFVADLARSYDGWSISRLRPIEQKINEVADAIGDGKADNKMLDKIDRLLAEWDEYSQPMQLMNEAKGLDDPRSKDIFNTLRPVAIDIANNHQQYEEALRISKALSHTFPELPGKARQLAKDIEILKKLPGRRDLLEAQARFVSAIKENHFPLLSLLLAVFAAKDVVRLTNNTNEKKKWQKIANEYIFFIFIIFIACLVTIAVSAAIILWLLR